MAFWPPTQILSFFAIFFSKKKITKNFLEKKFSPANAGTCFRPEKSKSAIKNVSPAPP